MVSVLHAQFENKDFLQKYFATIIDQQSQFDKGDLKEQL